MTFLMLELVKLMVVFACTNEVASQASYPFPNNIIGNWPLDSMNQFSDIGQHGLNLQNDYITNVVSDFPGPNGQAGTSFNCSGYPFARTYLSSFPNAFTLSFYIYISPEAPIGGIFSFVDEHIDSDHTSVTAPFGIYYSLVNPTSLTIMTSPDLAAAIDPYLKFTNVLTTNKWIWFAVTFNSGIVRLYNETGAEVAPDTTVTDPSSEMDMAPIAGRNMTVFVGGVKYANLAGTVQAKWCRSGAAISCITLYDMVLNVSDNVSLRGLCPSSQLEATTTAASASITNAETVSATINQPTTVETTTAPTSLSSTTTVQTDTSTTTTLMTSVTTASTASSSAISTSISTNIDSSTSAKPTFTQSTSKESASTSVKESTTTSAPFMPKNVPATKEQVEDLISGLEKIMSQQNSPSSVMQQVFPAFHTPVNPKVLDAAKCNDFAPDRFVPPLSGMEGSSPTQIQISFGIDSFLGLSTVNEIISVAATLFLSWNITTCPQNSDDYRSDISILEQLFVPKRTEVWTPPFIFLDSSESVIYMRDSSKFDEELVSFADFTTLPNKTLTFYWIKTGKFDASCSLDLAKFPFDKQTCILSFSLLRPIEYLAFSEPLFLWPNNSDDGSEWQFRSQNVILQPAKYAGMPSSAVHFVVSLARNPDYYLLNFVLPAMIEVLVEFGTFLIPPNETARPATSVTVLLAIAVTQSAVSSQIPHTSQRILLGEYVAGLSAICAFCAVYQSAACWITAWWSVKSSGSKTHRIFRRISPARFVDLIVIAITGAACIGLHLYAVKAANL